MSLTRANVEALLIKRCSKRMIFVGMDGTTVDGTNADLSEPISTALQRLSITPANIVEPADSDLTGVENVLELIDLAELRVLENIMGNMDMVDISVGGRKESLSQFADNLQRLIDKKRSDIEKEYGYGVGTISGGSISLDFQATSEDV